MPLAGRSGGSWKKNSGPIYIKIKRNEKFSRFTYNINNVTNVMPIARTGSNMYI